MRCYQRGSSLCKLTVIATMASQQNTWHSIDFALNQLIRGRAEGSLHGALHTVHQDVWIVQAGATDNADLRAQEE